MGQDGIARNTGFAFLAQVTTAIFTAALTIYLVRALGPEQFGLFALALAVGGMAITLADFGIPSSAARFLAEQRGDADAVARLLASALRLKLVAATIVAGALMAAAGPIADAYGEPGLTWPLRAIAISLWGQSLFTLCLNVFMALARISVNVRLIFVESAIETTASIALVALSGGAAAAAFGRALGYCFGGLVGAVVVVKLLGRATARPRRADAHGGSRAILRYALAMVVIDGAYVSYAQAGPLLIGAVLGATSVGLFAAPTRLITPLGYLGDSVASSVAPRQAANAREGQNVAAFNASLRWLIIVHAAMLAPLIVWSEPIVDLLLGRQFSESADVLRVLAPYVLLRGVSPLISKTVNYVGQAGRRIPIVLAALAISVAVNLALLESLGVVAAAIGTVVAYCVYVPAHLQICRKALHVPLRPLVRTVVRALLAATAMAAVLWLVGTGTLSAAQWLLGGAAAVAAYAAALVLSGEVSVAEIRRIGRVSAGLLAGGVRAASRAASPRAAIRRRGRRPAA